MAELTLAQVTAWRARDQAHEAWYRAAFATPRADDATIRRLYLVLAEAEEAYKQSGGLALSDAADLLLRLAERLQAYVADCGMCDMTGTYINQHVEEEPCPYCSESRALLAELGPAETPDAP